MDMQFCREYLFVLNLISESVSAKERHLQIFQWLLDHVMLYEISPIPLLTLSEVKEVIYILEYIRDQELKHFYLLQNLYFKHTGSYPIRNVDIYQPPKDLYIALQNAISLNLEYINNYNQLINSLSSSDDRDIIESIISDNLNQVNLYNYLLKQFELKVNSSND